MNKWALYYIRFLKFSFFQVLTKKLFLCMLSSFVLMLISCQSLEKRSQNSPQKIVKDIPLDPKIDSPNIKKRLMVLPIIDTKMMLTTDMSEKIKKAFIRELNKNSDVVAFDSTDLKVDKIKLNGQGQYDLKELQNLIKSYSVHSVLEAQLVDLKIKKTTPAKGIIKNSKLEYETSVAIKVIGQSGKELFNLMKTVSFKDQDGAILAEISAERSQNEDDSGKSRVVATMVKDTFFEFVPQVVKSLEVVKWEGRIASIQGERYFLNVGKVSGLNIGDLLRVTEDGEEIYDSESGHFIGKSPGRLKGTLEVISFFGQDGSIAVMHSGGGFRENDRIELY